MFNKQILVGRLGQDSELRFLSSGTPVLNFQLATDETWKDKQTGEKKKETTWHRVSIFGKVAESLSSIMLKGQLCLVEGITKHNQYEDNEGITRYSTNVVAQKIKLLGKSKKAGTAEEDVEVEGEDGEYNEDF